MKSLRRNWQRKGFDLYILKLSIITFICDRKPKKVETFEDKITQEVTLTEEETKNKVENLWASFKKEVEEPVKQNKQPLSVDLATETKTITKEFEFAGEKVK